MIEAPSQLKNTIANIPADHMKACAAMYAPTAAPVISVAPIVSTRVPTYKPSPSSKPVTLKPTLAPVAYSGGSADWSQFGGDVQRTGVSSFQGISSTTLQGFQPLWVFPTSGAVLTQALIALQYDIHVGRRLDEEDNDSSQHRKLLSTRKPTKMPSSRPVLAPTNTPLRPSFAPTNAPIAPSVIPTNAPIAPSLTPTNAPIAPSVIPTYAPSAPTVKPTKAPQSKKPTSAPSAPTNTPSRQSVTPTNAPIAPTNTPIAPTNTPFAPSVIPTSTPTAPTAKPSKAKPSKRPTSAPSAPSKKPTNVPSKPSFAPSNTPVSSVIPTNTLTFTPTKIPVTPSKAPINGLSSITSRPTPQGTVSPYARDVAYAGDEMGNMYALDLPTGSLIWQTQLGYTDKYCGKIKGPGGGNSYFGITGTPVFDRSKDALYSTGGNGTFYALSMKNGAILWSIPNAYDPALYVSYSALLLYNDIIYIPFAFHCDQFNGKKGKIIAISAVTRTIINIFYPSGSDSGGGMWGMGGAAMAIGATPASSYVYIDTGNCGVNAANGYCESIVKLDTNGNLVSYYQPPNNPTKGDNDLGAPITVFNHPSEGQTSGCTTYILFKFI